MELQAVRNNNVQLVLEVLDSLNNLSGKDAAAAELARILQEPHFKVILNLSFDFILTLTVVSRPPGGQPDFLDDLSDLLCDVEGAGSQALLPRCSAGQDALCSNSCPSYSMSGGGGA